MRRLEDIDRIFEDRVAINSSKEVLQTSMVNQQERHMAHSRVDAMPRLHMADNNSKSTNTSTMSKRAKQNYRKKIRRDSLVCG